MYAIPFKEKFDIVLSSLVVHYFKNWDKMFKQVSRVLKKGGDFIFSTGNPIYEVNKKVIVGKKKYKVLGILDYFKEDEIHAVWKVRDGIRNFDMPVVSYHKTYEDIIKTILKNGFEITDYRDCFPTKQSKKLFPEEYAFTSKVPFFCVWKVRKK